MSLNPKESTNLMTRFRAMVARPWILLSVWGLLVCLIALVASGSEALRLAMVGTLLSVFLFGLTHLVDKLLVSLAVMKQRASSKNVEGSVNAMSLSLTKRLAYGMLMRGFFAIVAIAYLVRFCDINNKLAVAIALPLYCGLLLAEITYAISRQRQATRNLAITTNSLQARI